VFGARLAAPSDKDVIAERVLERKTSRGVRLMAVRISRPEEDERDASIWSCRVEFLGFPRRARLLRYGKGVDQVQALLIALQVVHQELETLRLAGETMTWLGDSDLGFPGFGEPTIRAPRPATSVKASPRRSSTRRGPARR
jgi:hypothetical protein